jgi:hypothetical protein
MIRQLLLAFLVAALLLAGDGCARGSKKQAARQALQRYAELPGLAATHHQGLQEELARLRSEEATPIQLDARRQAEAAGADVTTSVKAPAAHVDRMKVDWSHFFHPQSLATAASRIDAAFPAGEAALTPIQLTSGRRPTFQLRSATTAV